MQINPLVLNTILDALQGPFDAQTAEAGFSEISVALEALDGDTPLFMPAPPAALQERRLTAEEIADFDQTPIRALEIAEAGGKLYLRKDALIARFPPEVDRALLANAAGDMSMVTDRDALLATPQAYMSETGEWVLALFFTDAQTDFGLRL